MAGVVHVAEIAADVKAGDGRFCVRKPFHVGRGKVCRVERQGCHIFCNPNVRVWLRRGKKFCRGLRIGLADGWGETVGGPAMNGPAQGIGRRGGSLPGPGRGGLDSGPGRRERNIHALNHCTGG